MAELLPEFWGTIPNAKDVDGRPNPLLVIGHHMRKVTDIVSLI